jgi:uncharacterized protein YuzE
MSITIAGVTFRYHDYDRRGDTLFLAVSGPGKKLAATAYETPEGHVVEYDESGEMVAVELVNVRHALDEAGEITLTCPQEHHVGQASLEAVLAA